MDTEVEIHIIQLLITLLRHDATAKPLWRLLEKNPALGEVLASGLKRSKSLVSPYLRLLSFLPLRKLDLNVRKMLAEAIAPFTSLQTSSPSIVSQSLKLLVSLCDETTCSSALNAFVPGFPVAVKLVEENWQQLFWTSLLRSMVSLLRKTDVQSILSDVSKTLIDDTVQTSLSTAIERRNTRLLSCLLPLLPVCDFLTVDRATLPARLAPLIPLWCEECEKPNQRRCLVALLHLLMKNPQAENVIPDVAATLQRVYTNDVKPLVSLLPDYLASLRPFPADLLPSLLPLLQPRFATLLEPLLRCILQWTPVEGLDSLAPLAGHLSPASRRLVYTLLEKQQALATVDRAAAAARHRWRRSPAGAGSDDAPATPAGGAIGADAGDADGDGAGTLRLDGEIASFLATRDVAGAERRGPAGESTDLLAACRAVGMIGGYERRLVATLELVARCAASPSFLASVYCRRFLHVLETRHALFVFYAPPLEDFASLPLPMRPELLSPVETGRLLRILLAVMRVADAPPKDANSLELRATVLRSVCVFVRVVFDPVSTYTVDCSVREECRSVFKRLVTSLPLDDVLDAEYVSFLRKECSC